MEEEIERVKQQIVELEKEIKLVEAKIAIAEEEWRKVNADKAYWQEEKRELREKERQLREQLLRLQDKEGRLEDEKLLLLRASLPSATAGPTPAGTHQRVRRGMVDFWKALPNAKWSADGKIMSLADETFFLGHEDLGDKLYLRGCYLGLEREVEDLFAQTNVRKRKTHSAVAIIGNPGIGKSMFGYLLLYHWARERRPIVVVKRGYRPTPTLLNTAGAFELDAEGLAEQLDNPEVRYLVDGVNPMDIGFELPSQAQTILLTSPNPNVYNEAWKAGRHSRRYMDVWGWEEIEECREGIFPDMDPAEVAGRYDRWGGIPRYVLEKLEHDDQSRLEEAITSTPLKVLVDSVGTKASPTEVSHKLIHLRVRADFQTKCMELASTYVAERVAYQLWDSETANLRRFLSASGGEGSVAALRGNLWEGFCHAKLAAGGSFKIRALSGPSTGDTTKDLPASSAPFIFDDWKDIQGKPHGQYLRPRSKTNESVDSAEQPNVLHQITVSRRHDLKCAGMRRALENLEQNGPGAVELYFALPPDIYNTFKGTEIKQGPGVAEVKRAVKQFALEVSF